MYYYFNYSLGHQRVADIWSVYLSAGQECAYLSLGIQLQNVRLNASLDQLAGLPVIQLGEQVLHGFEVHVLCHRSTVHAVINNESVLVIRQCFFSVVTCLAVFAFSQHFLFHARQIGLRHALVKEHADQQSSGEQRQHRQHVHHQTIRGRATVAHFQQTIVSGAGQDRAHKLGQICRH
jgi:hypothetical protein